ncbi:hypothetical protein Tco_1249315 [Tanacetum coccineum]
MIRVKAGKDGNLSSVDMEEGIGLTLPRANRLAEHGLETGDMKHDGKLNYIGSRMFKRSCYLTNYIFRTTFETEEDKSGVYVVLENILADSKHWEELEDVRKTTRRCGAVKQLGYSWIRS